MEKDETATGKQQAHTIMKIGEKMNTSSPWGSSTGDRLNRLRHHTLQLPLPIIASGSLAGAKGIHSVFIAAEPKALKIVDPTKHPSAVRFRIRPINDTRCMILEIGTGLSVWPWKCDNEERPFIVTLEAIPGGLNGCPASYLCTIAEPTIVQLENEP